MDFELIDNLIAIGIKVEQGWEKKKYFTIDWTNIAKGHKVYWVPKECCIIHRELDRAILKFNGIGGVINSDRVFELAFTNQWVLVIWREARKDIYKWLEQQNLPVISTSATIINYD